MRFDRHLSRVVRDRLVDVSTRMAALDTEATNSPELHTRLVAAIQPFEHTVHAPDLFVGAADAAGDFPALRYGDSLIYVTVATSTLYQSDPIHGLCEVDTAIAPLVEFTWLSSSERQRTEALVESFELLAGRSINEVLEGSDYRELDRVHSKRGSIRKPLIIPPAEDAGNIGIQLRNTAELAAALRLIEVVPPGTVVLTEGTMSLPFVQRGGQSLFFEHLRRFCCVRARERRVRFASISRSAILPAGIRFEEAAREKLQTPNPEHWFLRVPEPARDGWALWPSDGPRVPPPGAVSYLVRLHRAMPIMRIDVDAGYQDHGSDFLGTPDSEPGLLMNLDYASHDQRCYGYPYPIKAAQDRASLSSQERFVLRQQVVDAAVRAGMRRGGFAPQHR